jgi:hypothetical protein
MRRDESLVAGPATVQVWGLPLARAQAGRPFPPVADRPAVDRPAHGRHVDADSSPIAPPRGREDSGDVQRCQPRAGGMNILCGSHRHDRRICDLRISERLLVATCLVPRWRGSPSRGGAPVPRRARLRPGSVEAVLAHIRTASSARAAFRRAAVRRHSACRMRRIEARTAPRIPVAALVRIRTPRSQYRTGQLRRLPATGCCVICYASSEVACGVRYIAAIRR